MSKLEVKVETPLKWPGDRPRVRFQDRKNNAAWKLNYADTLSALERELHLNKVTFALVTYNSLGLRAKPRYLGWRIDASQPSTTQL